MKWFKVFSARIRALLKREAVIQDIDEEFNVHVDMQTDANIQRGMSATEARAAAIRSFGNLGRIKDVAYEIRGGGMIETLMQDIRYAARGLLKQKTFTVVAVITLALGIGANTAIFSVVNELLLRPLPYRDAERLVMVWERNPRGAGGGVVSRANFMAWRKQATSFEDMAAFVDQRLSLTGDGDPEEITVQLATPNLIQVLGVNPVLGRSFSEDDNRAGGSDVAVLSYNLWQRRYGGTNDVIGRRITLNGTPVTVIGVMPAGFQWYIATRSGTGRPAEMWTILPMPTAEGGPSRGRFLSVVARLKPSVSLQQPQTEMQVIAARLSQEFPQYNIGWSAEVIPLREQLVGNVRLALWVILGAVGFVLLIACANVANLLLSRTAAREKEMAVRAALGAGRLRIVRQLLTESLLLALLGSVLGLLLAFWGIKALVAISPRELVNLQHVGLNLTVLAWTMGISLLTGIIFGLAPALEATRMSVANALKEGKGEGQSPRSRRLRSALVVTEIALALVLLASAGLLVKSFIRLQRIDTGFEIENVMTMVVRLPDAKYREDQQIVGFFREAMDHIRSLPGVRSAGMVNYLPLYGGLAAKTRFTIEGRPAPLPGHEIDLSTNVRVADAGYFNAMGIPLLRGRNFTDRESSQATHVVLISESLARKHFPGEDPIGKRIAVSMFEKPNPTEIIGIVGDVRYDSLVNEPEPTVYFPHPELTYPFMTLVIRTNDNPVEIAPAVQREIRGIDPEQPVSDVRPMTQVMADTMSRARFNVLLLTLFAGLATVLAGVGIFGVMNYSLTLRTRELGLRMALGAQPRQVQLLMLKQGLLLTLIGTGIGVVGALAFTRVMSSLLFAVGASDPGTFAIIVSLLFILSLIACYLPSRRATHIDPLIALRSE